MRSTALALLLAASARGLARHGAERLPSAPSRGVLDGRHLRRSLNAVYNLRGGHDAPTLTATEPIDIETELELEEALEAAGDRLVVVDFHAEWCKPCKMLTPVVDELARKAGGKVVFLKVDVDEARDLSAAQGVKSMPTLIFFRNGKCVDTIVGADVPGLRERVARALANPLIGTLKDMCSSPALLIPSLLAYLALPRLLPLLRPEARRAPWLPSF